MKSNASTRTAQTSAKAIPNADSNPHDFQNLVGLLSKDTSTIQVS